MLSNGALVGAQNKIYDEILGATDSNGSLAGRTIHVPFVARAVG